MSSAPSPSIGVAVTAYHRTQFLERALTSVAQGSELPARVVVVEDNPPYSSGTSELLDRLFPSVPHAAVNQRFEPVGGLIATALELCTTDVVAFLEDDDLFVPDKVRRLRERFAASPEVGYVRNSFRGVDVQLEPIPMRRRVLQVPRGVVAANPKAWDAARIYGNCSSIAFRRAPALPYVPVLRELTASLDLGMFWLALRTDSTPYCEPTILTRKVIHLDSSSWKPFIYGRQRQSLEFLRSRSRPGSPEELFAATMSSRLPEVPAEPGGTPRPRDAGFRWLDRLQRRLPPRPASWLRRGSLMLVMAFMW